jgi:hypothetical protein
MTGLVAKGDSASLSHPNILFIFAGQAVAPCYDIYTKWLLKAV